MFGVDVNIHFIYPLSLLNGPCTIILVHWRLNILKNWKTLRLLPTSSYLAYAKIKPLIQAFQTYSLLYYSKYIWLVYRSRNREQTMILGLLLLLPRNCTTKLDALLSTSCMLYVVCVIAYGCLSEWWLQLDGNQSQIRWIKSLYVSFN